VITDRAAALLMVKRYGSDAMLEAAQRADQLLDEGNLAGAETMASHPERNRAAAGAETGERRDGALAATAC
jgi:hypothetical protein